MVVVVTVIVIIMQIDLSLCFDFNSDCQELVF